MRQSPILLRMICLGALSLAACAPEPEPTAQEVPRSEADVEAIKATLDQMLAKEKEGDLDGWLAFFSEDAVFMPPNETMVEGKDAVREWGQPYFERFTIEESVTLDEIQVCGSRAFTRGSLDLLATPKEGGGTVEDHAKMVQILERQSDNSWKFSLIIWNRDDRPK